MTNSIGKLNSVQIPTTDAPPVENSQPIEVSPLSPRQVNVSESSTKSSCERIALRLAFMTRQKVRRAKLLGLRLRPLPKARKYAGAATSWIKSLGRWCSQMVAKMGNRSSERAAIEVSAAFSKTLKNRLNPSREDNTFHNPVGNRFRDRPKNEEVVYTDRQLGDALRRRGWFKKHFDFRSNQSTYQYLSKTAKTPLFSSGPPSLFDVTQSDNRATCYFLSTLQGILAREDGPQRIENIMRDNGDGTVTVRFSNRDISVSKDHIVDSDGQDVFSGGADWVRVMEKAYLGYLLEERKAMRETYLGTNNTPDFDYVNKTSGALPTRFDVDSPEFAHNALANSMSSDPSQCSEQTGRKLELRAKPLEVNPRKNIDEYSTPQKMYDKLSQTLSEGGIVLARSKKSDFWKGRRLTPNHFYTIVSTATQNGQVGYLVRDPYGQSVGSRPGFRETETGWKVSNAVRGMTPLFFMSKEEAHELFGADVTVSVFSDNTES